MKYSRELEDAQRLADNFPAYFNKRHQKSWGNIVWSGASVNHNHQDDTRNCGVFTLKVT